MPAGKAATIDVAVQELTVRLTVLRVTVGDAKLVPVIVIVLAARFAAAFSTVGGTTTLAKLKEENDDSAAISRMALRWSIFIFMTLDFLKFSAFQFGAETGNHPHKAHQECVSFRLTRGSS
jgi:hypothetical protein